MDVPLDAEEFDRWRAQAQQAAAAAESLAATGQVAWACFLCEQAAQFGVKAILNAVGADPWGHDLAALDGKAAAALGEVWADVAASAMRLSRHYIPSRYPDAHPSGTPADHYGPEDLALAAEDRDRVLGAVDAAWWTLNEGEGEG